MLRLKVVNIVKDDSISTGNRIIITFDNGNILSLFENSRYYDILSIMTKEGSILYLSEIEYLVRFGRKTKYIVHFKLEGGM